MELTKVYCPKCHQLLECSHPRHYYRLHWILMWHSSPKVDHSMTSPYCNLALSEQSFRGELEHIVSEQWLKLDTECTREFTLWHGSVGHCVLWRHCMLIASCTNSVGTPVHLDHRESMGRYQVKSWRTAKAQECEPTVVHTRRGHRILDLPVPNSPSVSSRNSSPSKKRAWSPGAHNQNDNPYDPMPQPQLPKRSRKSGKVSPALLHVSIRCLNSPSDTKRLAPGVFDTSGTISLRVNSSWSTFKGSAMYSLQLRLWQLSMQRLHQSQFLLHRVLSISSRNDTIPSHSTIQW